MDDMIYEVLHDFLVIRDTDLPYFGYAALFNILDISDEKKEFLSNTTERFNIKNPIEESTDQLKDIWINEIEEKVHR
ncbi:MAG: hypothetical protein ACPHL7_07215 [Flavobacteriaceae bacterium]